MAKTYPVTRSYLPPLSEYVAELESIWDTHWLTNQGPLHQRLEQELKTYLHQDNITLFTNGHLALDVAIKALELKGEIITTPFTFVSTTHAMAMNGLKPVFCDIKPDDFTIDESRIEDLITPETSAILAVHVYGFPCAVHAIERIATRHNLRVIYDAAHAFGETVDNRPITSFGDVSMYSFHATKVFHTIEGGALVYSDPALKRSFDLYKNFGITGPETIEAIGLNAKMSEFQAAMGLVNLRHIDREIEVRGRLISIYEEELSKLSGIEFHKRADNTHYNNSYFPIIVDESRFGISRDLLFDLLWQEGICPRKYFYPLTSDIECYSRFAAHASLPIAKSTASSVLALPIYSGLEAVDIVNICQKIRSFSKASNA